MILRAIIFALCAFFAAMLAHTGEEIGDAFGTIIGRRLDPKSYEDVQPAPARARKKRKARRR